jgi:hypothetical protein
MIASIENVIKHYRPNLPNCFQASQDNAHL